MKTFLTSVAAVALIGSAAAAQQVILVPQGEGGAGQQQFILVPVPQQGPAQQGTAGQQGATGQQMRDRAEAMALDLYRRGYQRGLADAQTAAGPALDPAAMEQIGRELFERGYMLGLMQARAQITAEQAPTPDKQGEAGGAVTGAAGQTDTAGQQQVTPQEIAKAAQGSAGQAAGTEDAGQQQAQAQTGEQQPATQIGQQAVPEADAPEATIRVDTSEKFGMYLTDDNGRAVYMFTADQQGQGAEKAVSNCYDACAEAWPPVLAQSKPVEAAGPVKSELLSTIERKDGTIQVTYNGWPLYYYVRDNAEGTATGQDVHGFGGEWYLLHPSGEKVESE